MFISWQINSYNKPILGSIVDSTFMLFQLQKIYTEQCTFRSQILSFTKEIEDDSILLLAENNLLNLTNKLKSNEKDSAGLDQKILEYRNKVDQFTASLYGGKIQNSKELQDLQNEIAMLGKNIATLEDTQMQFWEEIESLQAEKLHFELEVADAREDRLHQKSILQTKVNQLNLEIERFLVEEKGIRDQVSAGFLNIYDRLLISKKGVAVAQIEENYCSCCGTTLTPADCQNAKIHSTLTLCKNCGRILYAG